MKITAVSKLKHTELWAAVKKFGSQRALAEALGENQGHIGSWCNLKSCPPLKPRGLWTQERIDALEVRVMAVFGKTLENLFPPELRDAEDFLRANKTIENTEEVEAVALLNYAANTTARLESQQPTAMDEAHQVELSSGVKEAMKRLTARERNILRLRFGLDGGGKRTYQEVAKEIGVTKERVRQVELRALRRMEYADKKRVLEAFLDDFEAVDNPLTIEGISAHDLQESFEALEQTGKLGPKPKLRNRNGYSRGSDYYG